MAEKTDSEKAEQLLGELRAIYQAYPEDANVRERFARGLSRVLVLKLQNGNQAAQSVYEEFRAFWNQHQDDARVAEVLGPVVKVLVEAQNA